MIKRIGSFLAVFAFLAIAAPVEAQTQLFVGAAATIPTSDYSDFDGDGPGTDGANTGWQATAGLTVALGEGGLGLYGRGFYGQNSHEADGEKTNPYGVMGGLIYRLGDPQGVGPFFGAGAGLLVHKYSPASGEGSSDSEFGWEGVAGLDFPLGGGGTSVSIFGMYNGTSGTQHFGFGSTLGFAIG